MSGLLTPMSLDIRQDQESPLHPTDIQYPETDCLPLSLGNYIQPPDYLYCHLKYTSLHSRLARTHSRSHPQSHSLHCHPGSLHSILIPERSSQSLPLETNFPSDSSTRIHPHLYSLSHHPDNPESVLVYPLPL